MKSNPLMMQLTLLAALVFILPQPLFSQARYLGKRIRVDSLGRVFFCLSNGSPYDGGNPDNGNGCNGGESAGIPSDSLAAQIALSIQDGNNSLSAVAAAVNANSQQLTTVSQQMTQINSTLVDRVDAFTANVRKSINDRFDSLPAELVGSPAIQGLRSDIEKDVLKKAADLAGSNQLPHSNLMLLRQPVASQIARLPISSNVRSEEAQHCSVRGEWQLTDADTKNNGFVRFAVSDGVLSATYKGTGPAMVDAQLHPVPLAKIYCDRDFITFEVASWGEFWFFRKESESTGLKWVGRFRQYKGESVSDAVFFPVDKPR